MFFFSIFQSFLNNFNFFFINIAVDLIHMPDALNQVILYLLPLYFKQEKDPSHLHSKRIKVEV